MHKFFLNVFKKAGSCQSFFSSLLRFSWLLPVILSFSFPVSATNDDCNNLKEDKNWQQTVSGLNGWDTWMGMNLKNYSFDLEQNCYCPVPEIVRIRVCEGRVFTVKNIATEELIKEPGRIKGYRTISGYFALIQELQPQHPDEIRVKLNRNYGYPEEIWINPSYRTGDDEIDIQINNVVPLKYD